MTKLNFKNKHEVPKLIKIVLNVGLGEDATDQKKIKSCQDDISSIAGDIYANDNKGPPEGGGAGTLNLNL